MSLEAYFVSRLKPEQKEPYTAQGNGTTTAASLRTLSRDAQYNLLLSSGIEGSFCRSVSDGILVVHVQYVSQSGTCTGRIITRVYLGWRRASP